jgi:hypothetical protein
LKTTVDRINKGIKCPDDALYAYAALVNGCKYIRCKGFHIDLKYDINLKNPFSDNNSKNNSFLINQYHNVLKSYIENKYNIQ